MVGSRPAAACVAALLGFAALSPAAPGASAATGTLRLFVSHYGVLQTGSVATWSIAIFNTGTEPVTGFGASGQITGGLITGVNCPLSLWTGVGSNGGFFECGNNGGYKQTLRPGQLAAFSITVTVAAPTGAKVTNVVTGLAPGGIAFNPPTLTDTGVVVARVGTGAPTFVPAFTPTPSATGTATSTATTGGSGLGYTLLLTLAFIVSGAGLFVMFTRQRRRRPSASESPAVDESPPADETKPPDQG